MRSPTFPIRRLLYALVPLAVAPAANAAIFAVGPGPGCTHTTIQAAINAAEANSGPDFIRIPHSQVWNNQALVINTNQDLWLEGYWSDCNTIDTSGTQTTLDGAGGSAAPVLRIQAGTGSFISLDSLTIRNGDVAGTTGKGGGIYYLGNGALTIANSAIINNTAGRGGGLYLEGTGTAASVQIFGSVAINGNTARDSGGGVFAEGLKFYMLQPNSIIAFNTATGYLNLGSMVGGFGGGLVVNPKSGLEGTAEIGGAGVGGAGVIYANTARLGGGVAVLGESGIGDDADLYMYTIDPARPVAIRDNFASVAGGGLYVLPRRTTENVSRATAKLFNASIDLNAAPDGAAIYLAASTSFANFTDGGWLWWNGTDRPPGAAPCPTDGACGRIANNVAVNSSGTPTAGAVINMREASIFHTPVLESGDQSRGIIIEGNRGGRLFDVEGGEDGVSLSLRNSLIVDNVVSLELVRARDEPSVRLLDSTIAGNSIGAGHVFAVSDELIVQRSIIWQPGKTSQVGPLAAAEWSFVSESASLGGGIGAVVVNPRFIDPARGDYRLRAASQAIDWAPPVTGDDRDVFGLPRDQRIGFLPRLDPSRVRDVGAHERAILLPLVLNGEFAGDTNLWFLPVGHAGNYQVNNAPGSAAGTGSAQVAGTSTAGRLLGYAQCIHLPGPGDYTLNGSARSEGNPQLSNPTALIWELRANGGEGCVDGAITASETHTLGTQQTADQWTRPAPAMISVPAALWNTNTSLTVIMAVYPNASNNNAYNGLFDAIRLEPASDVIFANGFD